MPRRQNVGVQVGAPVVPVLQGLSRLADAALRETKSLSADLRHVRGALLAHINDVADKTRTQLRTEFEELATTFKQQAKREAERGYIAVKTTAQEAAETAVAQLRLEHEKELQSIKNEMDQLQREFKQDLDGWQRQCYYYKTSEATLRREVDALRMAMPKSATHAQRIVASPRALQVHDDAKLLEEMHEKEVDLESARREVKTLSLEKKRLEFLLRVVRAKASEQLQQAAVRKKHLKHELDQTRESLKHTQDLMLSGVRPQRCRASAARGH
ncbi:hypothetical protein PTSG_02813 [Salpingoeca rosetta]|uniref:Uncharacterized protein n=1 Tax=Salpingoeca rosetta (strain ATCC 50818 / BSB-021) TaxID=946362 RepID=F2U3E5_SALR5|nr:uncharacterized protein PTSG_02813 [Salpingoeca rosetta]EGD82139.1 hypothetical protein PTSG_02813 [Salpingoeca rosetta]|eukprot:XP_004996322.1 hypothetical protein PTSG_02813 [Salpingoeca rosetta]